MITTKFLHKHFLGKMLVSLSVNIGLHIYFVPIKAFLNHNFKNKYAIHSNCKDVHHSFTKYDFTYCRANNYQKVKTSIVVL